MTFKIGFAAVAVAAFIGLSGTALQAAPVSHHSTLTTDTGLVPVQYRHGERRFGPPRRVCKWETVTKRVHGRIIRERIERCRIVRR
ncbi:hypothetical protein [Microvirga sp. M2]|uniref:hypothetical protein n=1 Tax=Microvirga sp. M2 TaxID=3073270 RepID=UPI0039C22619